MILVVKRFRLRAGVADEEFIAVDQQLQREFTTAQPGLLRCDTAKTPGGEWLVLQWWSSNEAADAVRGHGAVVVDAWMDLIDETTATMERFAALSPRADAAAASAPDPP